MKPDLRGIGMTSQRTRDRLVQRLVDKGIRDPRVLEVMRQTPRHVFVDEALASRAYEDTALPIGQGQTISQPYIVARMTEALLGEEPPARVLEIGTGCGYQSAVLAQLVEDLYSIERIAPLLSAARKRLRELGLRNVHLSHGDGGEGWATHAPYDAILVTAAPPALPELLVTQLADGGRLVIPVGPEGAQMLELVIRTGETWQRHTLEPVSFVPLLGGAN